MLGSLIRHDLSQKEASGEALLQVTATVLKIIMLHVITSPAVQKRLLQEIDDSVSNSTVSSPVKDGEARQMPYFQAVIMEGLRMKSLAGGAFFKTVLPGGDVINGHFVPKGTGIGVSESLSHNGVQQDFRRASESIRLYCCEHGAAGSNYECGKLACLFECCQTNGFQGRLAYQGSLGSHCCATMIFFHEVAIVRITTNLAALVQVEQILELWEMFLPARRTKPEDTSRSSNDVKLWACRLAEACLA